MSKISLSLIQDVQETLDYAKGKTKDIQKHQVKVPNSVEGFNQLLEIFVKEFEEEFKEEEFKKEPT